MASAIQNLNNVRILNIDTKKDKYAVNLNFQWKGLAANPAVNVPGIGTVAQANQIVNGFSDLFSILQANAAAQIPKVKRVVGVVTFMPLSAGELQAGGFYIYSKDSGQLIALEQFLNAATTPATPAVPGQINPGSISFSLPLEVASQHSQIQFIKAADASGTMSGSANISLLTYDIDSYLSR